MLASTFLQFTIGNALSLIVIAAFGTAGYYRIKGLKSEQLTETADFWREQAETMKEALEEKRVRESELEMQRDDQRRLKHDALNELAAEKLKTDLSGVVRQMAETQTAIVSRLEAGEHAGLAGLEAMEKRMQKRLDAWEQTQTVMVETMQGLLHGVNDLNKKISSR